MALQITFSDSFGGTHSTAYARITEVRLLRKDDLGIVSIEVYKDQDARTAAKDPLLIKRYTLTGDDFTSVFAVASMDPVDTNPIKLAYTYLKTLDEWSSASDV